MSCVEQCKANSNFFLNEAKRNEFFLLFGNRSETNFFVFGTNFLRIRSIRYLPRLTDGNLVMHRSIYEEYIGLLRRIHRFRQVVTDVIFVNVSCGMRLPMYSSVTDVFFVINETYRWKCR